MKAGVTLVASFVPTTMALGVISGMGPLAGLWCGVFVGVIAAVCGGTRAIVSGPSAVLAVITATLLMGDGVTLPELAVIIVMAGAIQIVLGLAGVGRYVSYMPHIVLTGFMSGIGVLLLSTQVEKLVRLGTSDVFEAAMCPVFRTSIRPRDDGLRLWYTVRREAGIEDVRLPVLEHDDHRLARSTAKCFSRRAISDSTHIKMPCSRRPPENVCDVATIIQCHFRAEGGFVDARVRAPAFRVDGIACRSDAHLCLSLDGARAARCHLEPRASR